MGHLGLTLCSPICHSEEHSSSRPRSAQQLRACSESLILKARTNPRISSSPSSKPVVIFSKPNSVYLEIRPLPHVPWRVLLPWRRQSAGHIRVSSKENGLVPFPALWWEDVVAEGGHPAHLFIIINTLPLFMLITSTPAPWAHNYKPPVVFPVTVFPEKLGIFKKIINFFFFKTSSQNETSASPCCTVLYVSICS